MLELTSNGIIKGLLGKVASLIRRVQDLVVENGEVEGQAETNWVGWCKVGLRNFGGVLVGLEGLVGGLLSLVTNGKLSEVTVVITLPVRKRQLWEFVNWIIYGHLVVEDLRLSALSRRNQVLVENLKDIFANLGEFGLDLLTVLLNQGNLNRVSLGLLLLLNRGDDSPRRAASANNVLVGNGEEISLFDREFLVLRGNGLHVLNHF